jgi:hypothetical protein
MNKEKKKRRTVSNVVIVVIVVIVDDVDVGNPAELDPVRRRVEATQWVRKS